MDKGQQQWSLSPSRAHLQALTPPHGRPSLSVTDLIRDGWHGREPMKSKQPTTSKTTRQRPARRTKPGPHTPSVSANLHERIATRAFENYERRIRQGPLDDWLQAEQEILGQKNARNADMPYHGGSASEEQD